MWNYSRNLQYPVNIRTPNPRLAKIIVSQYGGPDGELGASLRYLSQKFGMPDQKTKGLLNDIGTEELRAFGNGWNNDSSVNKKFKYRRNR